MGRPIKDLSGNKFGRWLVINRDNNAPSGAATHPKWNCICDCGKELSVYGTLLKQGASTSCGCFQKENVIKRNTKHGTYGTKAYWSLLGAKKRANKLNATPIWANQNIIREIYKKCPSGYHVDHIVPLNSPIVCGLHWEGNLQYLTAKENCSKRNKLLE